MRCAPPTARSGARCASSAPRPPGIPSTARVGPGETVRMFTGSVVPTGADAILMQEDADRDGDTVEVGEAVGRAATSAAPARILPPAMW